ncbi:MAG: ABC transporter substrate-binding protein [Actinomyces sp.]|nr:ABC transporter substrate-binding protein [Actinomyces sp.]MCI1787386.1 ABC transporter substrate-binding protein [Actinomyces sp.]MCI1830796.1 ABC transporter substrate-binding protein [Actinomyces sp.]
MRRRGTVMAAVGAAAALVALAGCSNGGQSDASDEESGSASADCAAYADYGHFDDAVVSVMGSFVGNDADLNDESWAAFEKCTGIDVQYNGDSDFESQVVVQVEAGNAPDVVIFPQVGLMQRFAESGDLVPAPDQTKENAEAGWNADMVGYGTVDDTFYAAPFTTAVKSFVWYSPSLFAEHGYTVPETWDEMIALSDQMAADGMKPWCEGAESGSASGWPLTDWVEVLLLANSGGETYDKWVDHEIPFNDSSVVEATDLVGKILKNNDYVNGGFGDSSSIVSTSNADAPLPITTGECGMHLAAGTAVSLFDDSVNVDPEGDVYAFPFPVVNDEVGNPVTVSGQFTAAFSDRPEVQAFQNYVSSVQWANDRAPFGGYISSNSGMDSSLIPSAIDKSGFDILNDPDSVLRFDGSDLMPSTVGTGTFWTEMLSWIQGASTEETLGNIEASWPADN